jgi:hypothetical protein
MPSATLPEVRHYPFIGPPAALRLFFGLALGLPSFISDCGLGGVLNAARRAASVRCCVSCSPVLIVRFGSRTSARLPCTPWR